MPAHTYTVMLELPKPVRLRTFSGEVARALFLNMLDSAESGLAEEAHGEDLSPYSVSPFLTRDGRTLPYSIPAGLVKFRVSALSQKVADAMAKYLVEGGTRRMEVRVYGVEAVLVGVRLSSFVATQDSNTRFAVIFRTPTAFRTKLGIYVVYPSPFHLLKGLAKLFKKYEDPTLPYRSYLRWLQADGVVLETYDRLQVHRVPDSHGWWRGFTGRAVYQVPEQRHDPKMVRLTNLLLNYASFANVGKNRTAGYGFVSYRPLNELKRVAPYIGGRRRTVIPPLNRWPEQDII
jgi:CRISPR-associated endoribonuclease Cas6